MLIKNGNLPSEEKHTIQHIIKIKNHISALQYLIYKFGAKFCLVAGCKITSYYLTKFGSKKSCSTLAMGSSTPPPRKGKHSTPFLTHPTFSYPERKVAN